MQNVCRSPASADRLYARMPLALMLALALLFAQWAGFSHRIEHRAPLHLHAETAMQHIVDAHDDDETSHSCSLYDAATLGATLQTATAGLPLLPTCAILAAAHRFASWNATPYPLFRSRAPPQ